jgi:histidine triad (HIT) family protein
LPYTGNMSDEKDTLFLKIIRREIPATIIFEDEESIAFMDIHPIAKGHVLLITKEPYRWMDDVPDELLGRTFIKAKKLIKAMKSSLGCDLVHSVVEGKEVPHFHIKLIPDMLHKRIATWQQEKYEENEIETYAEKIKNAL